MFLVLAFVVLLSSCQIFFLAGVYEELQDKYGQGKYGISYIYVYVSTSGNDANDGLSPSKPVRTLVKAMEIANTKDKAANVVIKVGSGVYTNGDGLSTNVGFVINRPNLIISGGWDSSFSSVEGKSELDGNGSLYHVVMIRNVTNVKLENLVIRGGNANGSSYPDSIGGGIYVSNVSYLVIENNVVISNNSAQYGGGLYLWYSTSNTISGSVYSNRSKYGGGLYLYYSSNNTISGSVYGNSANTSGGGLYLWYSTSNTISGSVYSNRATYDGGGLYLYNSTYNTISGSVYSNGATYNGGGLYLYNSTYNTISGSVYGNSADYGGGVFLWYSQNTTISGSVYGNSATNYGGGVYLADSLNTTISGSVYTNIATWGGGVYLVNSDYFTNTGWITNNTASSAGGGVYRSGSYSSSYFGNVSNNSPNDIAP
jgi:parallel beta-helix repeat protein